MATALGPGLLPLCGPSAVEGQTPLVTAFLLQVASLSAARLSLLGGSGGSAATKRK